jgi:hypothetical protein
MRTMPDTTACLRASDTELWAFELYRQQLLPLIWNTKEPQSFPPASSVLCLLLRLPRVLSNCTAPQLEQRQG